MKKRIFLNFAFVLCGALAILLSFGLVSTPLAYLTAFTENDTQEITISIEGYTPQKYTRVRYFDNAIYLIDQDNKSVIKHDLKFPTSADTIIHSTDSEKTEEITEPYDITSFDGEYLISTTTRFVDSVTTQNSTTLNSYYATNQLSGIALSHPQTLASSANGTTYLINNGLILYYNKAQNQLQLFADLKYNESNLTFANGGFCVTEDNSTIYFSIGTQIYQMNISDKQITPLSLPETELATITYLNTDNLGNLYVGCGNTIYKLNKDATEYQTAEITNATSFDIDFVNGKIYYITSENKVYMTEISENSENFVTNYSKIAPSVQLSSIPASENAIKAVKTTKTTQFYRYQSLLSATSIYDVDKKLIVLDESNSNFYYIFDNNCDNSAGFQLGYVLKTDCEFLPNEIPEEFADNAGAKVITGLTKVFYMPISQEIATDTYISSLGTLTYGDVIAVEQSPILSVDSNGATFIAVKYTKNETTYIGYIDSRTVVSSELTVPDNESVPNAKTKTETAVYSEKSCFNAVTVLEKGSEVKIVSTQNGVSKIEYYTYDGENRIVNTGYCKTENLDNGNLTTAQIVGIVLMSVSVLVTIIALILIHRHKRKINSISSEMTD